MNESKFASLWTRALGGAIDVAILFVITYVVCYIWTSNEYPSEAYLSDEALQSLWKARFIFTWLIADLIYSVVFMTSNMQATIGQKVVGIKIVKNNGEKIGYGAAIGRNLMSIISSIFLKIGYIIAATRKDRKTLHDLVAGTIVIYSPNLKSANAGSALSKTSSTYVTANDNFQKASSKSTSQNRRKKMKKDEDFWEEALYEFESENRKKGLYAKLYALHTGNEAKIKSEYLQERYSQLKEANIAAKLADVKNEFTDNSPKSAHKKIYAKKLSQLNSKDLMIVIIGVIIIGTLHFLVR
jgi:uncharacterized RDD family membrane protein YckC